MPATRTSSRPAEITLQRGREEIIANLATGLVRLIRAGEAHSRFLGQNDPHRTHRWPGFVDLPNGARFVQSDEGGLPALRVASGFGSAQLNQRLT